MMTACRLDEYDNKTTYLHFPALLGLDFIIFCQFAR